ncbi:fumarylacetoacetate hydrolase family protein [Georgenia sp. Z1344]|uniref:fumarylacetoacetate hydrolase family protein n=1 Tax=Georgenia sp. Z1344 TaxID=3416706 RepID=UPI003CF24AF3
MRIVRYVDSGRPAWGIVDGETVRAATGTPFVDLEATGRSVGDLDGVPLLAPVHPRAVVCVGRNYRAHAEELGNDVPTAPLLFLKPPSTVIGPGATINLPPESSRVDHEAELVVVMGSDAFQVSATDALSYVGGYTCGNDVTARDIQKSDPGGQWTRGKGFDTFCPVGPWIDTDLDPSDIEVSCTVSGETRQSGRTRDLIFDISFLIEYVSRFMGLERGDILMTGTPAGVGPLVDGDSVTVSVGGLGSLTNPVRAVSG